MLGLPVLGWLAVVVAGIVYFVEEVPMVGGTFDFLTVLGISLDVTSPWS